jgi:hypothetical protein
VVGTFTGTCYLIDDKGGHSSCGMPETCENVVASVQGGESPGVWGGWARAEGLALVVCSRICLSVWISVFAHHMRQGLCSSRGGINAAHKAVCCVCNMLPSVPPVCAVLSCCSVIYFVQQAVRVGPAATRGTETCTPAATARAAGAHGS